MLSYNHFLWRTAYQRVQQRYGEQCERNVGYYYIIEKETKMKVNHYTEYIVTDYMNKKRAEMNLQIPRVLYKIVSKYAKVDPPRGT